MPLDICMCAGGDCPQKDSCLRFTGAIYGRQDFFGTPPYSQMTGECVFYMDERPTEAAVRRQAHKLWEHDGAPEGKELEYWARAESYLINIRRNKL